MESVQDLRTLTLTTCLLACIGAVLFGCESWLNFAAVPILQRIQNHGFADIQSAQLSLHSAAQNIMLAHWLAFFAFLVTAVCLLTWIYQSSRNLRFLTERELDFTPRWAVGWWFIPFANIVQPYRIMVELWIESDSTEGWMRMGFTAPVLIWWLLWLGGNAAASISGVVAGNHRDVANIISSTEVLATAKAILGICALMLAYIVFRIGRMQFIAATAKINNPSQPATA